MSDYRTLAFVVFPEDWVGRTIEVYSDGYVGLDSGLTTKERRDRGEIPVYTKVIEQGAPPAAIMRWLDERFLP